LNKSLHFVLILSLRLSWVFVLRGLREFCSSLQAVAAQVPLGGFLDGVGALEEFLAGLLLVSAAVGIQVFIQKFPHIVGERQDFQVFGVLESVLELLGHVAVVFGFLHDFADEPLLAVQVIVVELFVQVLEHGDPLDDVKSVVVISIIGRPILGLLLVFAVILLLVIVVVTVVLVGAQKTANIDEVSNDAQKDKGAQKGKGGGGAGGVKVEESGLFLELAVELIGVSGGREAEQDAN